jgi:hypothetical protein
VLAIDLQGAQVLLALLARARNGELPGEAELETVLTANEFFIDFYSRWEGITRERIIEALYRFNQPEWAPSERLLATLVKGFRQAVDEVDVLQARMDFMRTVNPSAVTDRVLAYLPADTPLESAIHITVDAFNNAFVHRGEMGVSLLKGITDRKSFEDAVAHELHHVGFRFWAERDPVRQALLEERSGCTVAVHHVQNLLAEGMANYYCTPEMVFRDVPDESAADPFEARLARLRRDEPLLFARAEEVLALSLSPGADPARCREAFRALALDMEEGLLPAAHYIGARMVETMSQFHSLEEIVGCVQNLPSFLPLYNQAAQEAETFVFDPRLVDQFGQMWGTEMPG